MNLSEIEKTVQWWKGNSDKSEIGSFIWDVLYGAANIFGQGENLEEVRRKYYGLLNKQMPTSADLTQFITKITAEYGSDNSKFLTWLDNKLNSLPLAYSQNAKKVVQGLKQKFTKARRDASILIDKSNTLVDSANQLANQIPLSTPSQRDSAIEGIKNTLKNVGVMQEKINDIERTVK